MTNNIKQRQRLNTKALKALPWSGGFTLIETLIAVLLLATAIAGPLTIASKSLTTALVAKDQIIAYYLAQDAIEYVRFKRDSNRLAGVGWLTGLDGPDGSSGCLAVEGCNVDSVAATVTACSSACTAIKFNTTSNTYNSTGTMAPAFTRTIKMNLKTIDEVLLTVTVTWSDVGSVVHKITAKESLFNWQL